MKRKELSALTCFLFFVVVVVDSITDYQLRHTPLAKSRRRKTEYALATALHTHVPYTLVRLSPQSLSPRSLSHRNLSPQSLSPQSLRLQSLNPQSLSPQSQSPWSLSPQIQALALRVRALGV